MARPTPEQWQAIRTVWEYDPDEPSLEVAATRAGKKYDFAPPRRQSVHERAKNDGWERRASLNGINQAAQRLADERMAPVAVPQPDGVPDTQIPLGADTVRSSPADAAPAMAAWADQVDKRAQVNMRHRQEGANLAILRNEALSLRNTDPVRCSEKLRQVKIAAEITAIQQAIERKAWGLDLVVDPDQLKNMSDEDLNLIAAGKMPRGR